MPGPGVFKRPRLESPLHTVSFSPHGEVLASEHGVLGKLLRHGEMVDSTLKKGQHLLSVNGYHYVFEVLSDADRQKIHKAFGVKGSPVFTDTLARAIQSLRSIDAEVSHRVYQYR